MARDPEQLAHQQWLGYVQPVGLVVSIPALLAAQAHVNRNIAPEHQQFLALPLPRQTRRVDPRDPGLSGASRRRFSVGSRPTCWTSRSDRTGHRSRWKSRCRPTTRRSGRRGPCRSSSPRTRAEPVAHAHPGVPHRHGLRRGLRPRTSGTGRPARTPAFERLLRETEVPSGCSPTARTSAWSTPRGARPAATRRSR